MTTMKALILKITEKNTFNGVQLGFVLDNDSVYFPFFQHLVNKENIGKYINTTTISGTKTEFITEY